jgi:hypothetical protein
MKKRRNNKKLDNKRNIDYVESLIEKIRIATGIIFPFLLAFSAVLIIFPHNNLAFVGSVIFLVIFIGFDIYFRKKTRDLNKIGKNLANSLWQNIKKEREEIFGILWIIVFSRIFIIIINYSFFKNTDFTLVLNDIYILGLFLYLVFNHYFFRKIKS